MEVTKVEAYKCPVCHEVHEDETQAYECCLQLETTTAFQCGNCTTIYADLHDAIDCCQEM
jgi:hypothetical protein